MQALRDVAAAIVAAAGMAAVGGAVAQEALTFDVKFNDTIIQAQAGGLSLGDRFILSDTLQQGGADAGSISGVCTVTNVSGVALCSVTFSVPDGTISAQFVNSPDPQKSFAVIGGTGKYVGARGSGSLTEAADQTGTVTFALLP